jgi:hypothetical protein
MAMKRRRKIRREKGNHLYLPLLRRDLRRMGMEEVEEGVEEGLDEGGVVEDLMILLPLVRVKNRDRDRDKSIFPSHRNPSPKRQASKGDQRLGW